MSACRAGAVVDVDVVTKSGWRRRLLSAQSVPSAEMPHACNASSSSSSVRLVSSRSGKHADPDWVAGILVLTGRGHGAPGWATLSARTTLVPPVQCLRRTLTVPPSPETVICIVLVRLICTTAIEPTSRLRLMVLLRRNITTDAIHSNRSVTIYS